MVSGKRKFAVASHTEGPPRKCARHNLTSTAVCEQFCTYILFTDNRSKTTAVIRNGLNSALIAIQSYTKKTLLRVFDECGVNISPNECRTKTTMEEYLQSLDDITANTILSRLKEVSRLNRRLLVHIANSDKGS
jgi:hypothetical protein